MSALPQRSLDVRGLLLLTTAMWGMNMAVIKLLTGHFDALWLSALRMASACLPLAVLLWRTRPVDWRLERGELSALLLCGVLMVYLNQWLLTAGLRLSSATNASLITALNPLVAGVFALWLLGEHLSGRRLVGVALGLAGVALVILKRPAAELVRGGMGDLLVLGAVFTFTLAAVLVQRLGRRLDALRISLFIHAVGAVCLLSHATALALFDDTPARLPADGIWWAVAVLSGALSTGLGNLMWNVAIGRVGMSRAAVWLYWVPVFGLAAAALFLEEPLSLWHLLGLALILGGTHLGTRTPPQPV